MPDLRDSTCRSKSIPVETERPIALEEARELFAALPRLTAIDDTPNGR